MRLSRGRFIAIAAAVLVLTGAGYAMRPRPLDVETGPVTRGPLETTVDADGRTRVRDRFVIAAPVSGRMVRMSLAEGDIVQAGDVVARIAPLPIDPQAAEAARSRLAGAMALAEEAASRVRMSRDLTAQRLRELDRSRRLIAAGALAPRDTESSWLAWRQASEDGHAAANGAEAASADVRQARAALMALGAGSRPTAVTSVHAPARGRVLVVPEASERVIMAGAPIVEVGDPRKLEVVIDVLSSDGAQVTVGDPVRLERWGGDAPLAGTVRRIEPSGFTKVSALGVDEQRVNVIVDVPAAPPSVGDGFRVEARIVTWHTPSAVLVPASALVRDGSQWVVYVADGSRAFRRRVRIGHLGEASAEVLDGLTPGTEVILFPSDKVVDGGRIAAHHR